MNYGKKNTPEYFIAQLKKAGMSDEFALAVNRDIATAGNPSGVLNEYKQDFSRELQEAESMGPYDNPNNIVDGELRFALSKNQYPAGINTDDVHTVIAGSSKTGKTYGVDIINSAAVSKGHKIWMFVKTDDSTRIIRRNRDILYCDFIVDDFKVNPLLFLPAGIFVSIFRYSFVLFEGSETYLSDSLAELNKLNKNPALIDLFYFIRARKHNALSRTARYQESVVGRLKELVDSPLNKTFNCIRGHEQDIVNTSAIFNISKLTLTLQKFFVCSMLELLYLHNMEDGHAHDYA